MCLYFFYIRQGEFYFHLLLASLSYYILEVHLMSYYYYDPEGNAPVSLTSAATYNIYAWVG